MKPNQKSQYESLG